MKKSMFILIVAISLLLCACSNQLNEVTKEVDSPDGKYKAVCFTRNLGATTRNSNQLAILPKSKKLGNEAGNICITYGDLTVTWETNKVLDVTINNIESSSDDIFKQLKQYNEINIKYTINNN